MKKTLFPTLITIALFNNFPLLGQEDSQGGGESAAESSVSSSSSEKKNAVPESLESNPIVTVVKAGIPFETARTIQVSTIIKVAQAGGTVANLKTTASVVSSRDASIDNIVSAIDAGITFSSAGGAGFLDVAKKVKSGTITVAELADVKTNLDNGVDLDAQIDFGIADTKTAIQAGYTADEILSVSKLDEAAKATRQATIKSVSAQVVAGQASGETVDKDALESIVESSGGGTITDEQIAADKFASTVKALTANSSLLSAIDSVLADADYSGETLQTALTSAVTVANTILTDEVYTGSTSLTPENVINVGKLTASGYNTELIKLLIKYGAIGDKGSELAAGALNGFSTDATTSSSLSTFLSTASSTSDYIGLLSTLTGDSTIGDADGDDNDFLNPTKNTVLNVNMNKVSLAPAANITVGAKDSSTIVNVSDILTKAANHADRKILVVGAAKDLTIAGDTKFHNTNDVEDHALVLGAADELYFRSEMSSANNADYSNPEPINLEYTGSNLGLGSESKMHLINVNIKTGGNLAIASLDELHVGTADSHSSTFSVGTGGKNSDPDNVYMYASNLISVNGLAFAGNVDDVYMDAITIDLKDVTFPVNSDVMLRSRDGGLNIVYDNGTRTVGDVNFIDNVKHLGIGNSNLVNSDFDISKGDGHINSTSTLPNGRPLIKIRSR